MTLEQIINFVAGSEWVWIGIIVAIFAIVGFIAITKSIAKKIPTAKKKQLDVLRGRLAKGEISQEEYDKIKKEFE